MEIKALIAELGSDSSWKSLRAGRKALREALTRPDRLALARFLMGKGPSARADFDSRAVRIGVASDTSLDNLAEAIALRLLERGMFGQQYHAPFAQVALEVRNPASGLFGHRPEVVVLAPLTGLWQRSHGAGTSSVPQIADEAWGSVTTLRGAFDGLILLMNLLPGEVRPHGILDPRMELGRADLARAVNLELSRRCRETGLAFILDAELLATQCGTAWPTLHKQYFMGSRPISDELANQLALDIAAFCAARKGFARKCLALDLDNTLWGGVIGEDGIAGIKLGSGFPGALYVELQREIRALNERGVLLAINSKNNPTDAWEVFEQRSEMVLARKDFSACRVNWQDKATNLRELAAELNIGLDAFVMMDDNPVERDWIEESLPEVEVCPSGDPIEMLRWLVTSRRFDTLGITKEDALRAQSYAAADARTQLKNQTGNLEDYLASLETKVEVGWNTPSHLARVAQLTQKTNQFNLTTRRYNESEIQEKLNDPNWRIFWCACRDRFADEGVIGAALARITEKGWHLDTFLMSCRVLGRGVEKSFLSAICAQARKADATSIVGEYLPTAKNVQTEDFYEKCGFLPLEKTAERSVWRLPLEQATELSPAWIKLSTVSAP
jgi:FkbH-like protein